MASIVRPAILRQTCLAAASKRAFSNRAASSFPAIKPSSSILSNPAIRSSFSRDVARIAAFHTSSRKSILPPLPQSIEGSVNEAAPIPPTSPTHGSYHWTFERLIAASLIPLTITPFVSGSLNPMTDAILCSAILIHSHIGFESMIIDYLPEKRVLKTKTALWWLLRAGTVAVGVGLYEFETNDVGLTEAIKRIWTA
ncbi:CybS-domain-containing protein [Xylogone sp. PMI_703]|nr:CybS-domain-containing protein [Xylogone sp. PMI_703]